MQIQIHFRTRYEKKKIYIYILKANVLFRRHENDVGRVRRAYDRVDFQHRVQRDVHHIIFFRVVCYIYSLFCLKVVFNLSVPYYILTLKNKGYSLSTALVRRGYSHTLNPNL